MAPMRRALWVLGALVLVFMCHATWDYFEARAVDRAIADWDATASRLFNPNASSDRGEEAASFEVVRAFVSKDWLSKTAPRLLIWNHLEPLIAPRAGGVDERAVRAACDYVAGHAAEYDALDRAAARDFRGVSDTSSGDIHLGLALIPLRLFASLRTNCLLRTHRADAAVSSLQTQVRLDGIDRQLGRAVTIYRGFLLHNSQDVWADLQRVLSVTTPSPGALSDLADTLNRADDPLRLARYFADEDSRRLVRSIYLVNGGERTVGAYQQYLRTRTGWPDGGTWRVHLLARPAAVNAFRSGIRQSIAVLDAASQLPWPKRLSSLQAAFAPRHPSLLSALTINGVLRRRTDASWETAELQRAIGNQAQFVAARVAVAVERYRRDHLSQLPERLDVLAPDYLPEIPQDPMSGEPMLFAVQGPVSYIVYSRGQNRQDDGGLEVDLPPVGPTVRPRLTGDIGVRVRPH